MKLNPRLNWRAGLSGTRLSKTEAEFHAPALEMLLARPPRVARLLAWAMIAVVVAVVVWTTLAKVDEVVVARGKIIPVGYVQTVQSQVSGSVLEIRVSNGERVVTGDLLVKLDDTQAISRLAKTQTDLAIATTNLGLTKALLRYVTGEQQALPRPHDAGPRRPVRPRQAARGAARRWRRGRPVRDGHLARRHGHRGWACPGKGGARGQA